MATIPPAFSSVTTPAAGTEDLMTAYPDDNSTLTGTERTIRLVVSILCGLLLIRFVLALFGATANNPLISLVYTVTAPFIFPFQGLFTNEPTLGTARFEIETLVAIIVYLLLGAGIVYALKLFRND